MLNARLLHYSHCVSDLTASRRFYVDVLGFRVVAEFTFDDADTAKVMGVPGARFTGLFLDRDGMRVELIAFTNPPPDAAKRRHASNEIGHSHFSFYVTNLDESLAYLRSHGVPIDDGSRAVLQGSVECCVVRDPDGFPIEIVQVPTLALLPYEGM